MSRDVVRLASGGAIQVRTGVLKGAGPLGPTGPVGPTGPQGAVGPTGPNGYNGDAAGTMAAPVAASPQSITLGASPVVVTNFGTPAASNAVNPLTRNANKQDFGVTVSGSYQLEVYAVFTSGSGSTGRRSVAVHTSGSATPLFEAEVPVNASGKTKIVLPVTAYFTTATVLNVRVSTTGSTDTLESITISAARLSTGAPGPTGPTGPQGLTGPTGPQGPTGSSGSGYATFENLVTGGGSGTNPNDGVTNVGDQGYTQPATTGKPAMVWWLRALYALLERRGIAVFASSADRDSKRPTQNAAEITYLSDTGSLWIRNNTGQTPIAQVQVSGSAPAAGATGAPGSVWFQV